MQIGQTDPRDLPDVQNVLEWADSKGIRVGIYRYEWLKGAIEGNAHYNTKYAEIRYLPAADPQILLWALCHEIGHLYGKKDKGGILAEERRAWAVAHYVAIANDITISPAMLRFMERCLDTYRKGVK